MKNSPTFTVLLAAFLIGLTISIPSSRAKPQSAKTTQAAQTQNDIIPLDEDDQEANLLDSSDDEDENEDDTEQDNALIPTLTCVLFDDSSLCDAMCSMIGSIYGYPVTDGICKEGTHCECSISPQATFDDLWNKKFNAVSVLKEIRNNNNLVKKVTKILRKPSRTREQTLQDLQSILTPEQLQNIKVRDIVATKILLPDGKPNKKIIKKYVAAKLAPTKEYLQEKTLPSFLIDFLDEYEKEDTEYVMRSIRRTDNKQLNDVINDYVKKHKIPESTFENNGEETLIDVLDTTIANQLNQRTKPKMPVYLIRKPAKRVKPTTTEAQE